MKVRALMNVLERYDVDRLVIVRFTPRGGNDPEEVMQVTDAHIDGDTVVLDLEPVELVEESNG